MALEDGVKGVGLLIFQTTNSVIVVQLWTRPGRCPNQNRVTIKLCLLGFIGGNMVTNRSWDQSDAMVEIGPFIHPKETDRQIIVLYAH